LLEVREFPEDSLDDIKKRASLLPIDGVRREEFGPRRLKAKHLPNAAKKPKGDSEAVRVTGSRNRLKPSA